MAGTSAFSLIVNAYIVKGNVDLRGSRLVVYWPVWSDWSGGAFGWSVGSSQLNACTCAVVN